MTNITTQKIRLLKSELKNIAEYVKAAKVVGRKNQSLYDKTVVNPIRKAIESGEVKVSVFYSLENVIHRTELGKKLYSDYISNRLTLPESKIQYDCKDFITSGYILYHELRETGKNHLGEKNVDQYYQQRLDFYRKKWLERLESLVKKEEDVNISSTTSN